MIWFSFEVVGLTIESSMVLSLLGGSPLPLPRTYRGYFAIGYGDRSALHRYPYLALRGSISP